MPLRETVVQDAAAAWKEGNKMQQPRRLEGGEHTRGTRATKSTAAEELAPVLGEIVKKS